MNRIIEANFLAAPVEEAKEKRSPRTSAIAGRTDSWSDIPLASRQERRGICPDYGAFKSFVATGATDDEIAAWIGQHAKKRSRAEIIAWNNKERDLRLSDLPPETQEYMEDYIAKFVPRNRVVYHWFDAYDLEEERL